MRLLEQGAELDTADVDAWLAQVEHDTLAALRARGQATAAELTEDVPALGERITYAPDERWGAPSGCPRACCPCSRPRATSSGDDRAGRG